MSIKMLKTGNIIGFQGTSHDAILFDSKLKEIKRVKGEALPESWLSIAPNLAKKRSVDCDVGGDIVLWISGNYKLSYLDTMTMQATEIPNFWLCQSQWCFGMCVVMTKDNMKVAGIGLCNDQQSLHVLDSASSKFNSRFKSDLLKGNSKASVTKVEEMKCLEISSDQSILFIGGGFDNEDSIPKIAAVTFDFQMKVVCEKWLEVDGMSAVYSLKS